MSVRHRHAAPEKERPPPSRLADHEKDERHKLTFSFDSGGWLYLYHLGVAQYLQRHLLPHLSPDDVAFSGSSGGALVAVALCTDVDIEAQYVARPMQSLNVELMLIVLACLGAGGIRHQLPLRLSVQPVPYVPLR